MVQSRCRLWNICVATIVVLSMYNILLTTKIMYTQDCPKMAKVKRPEIQRITPMPQNCNHHQPYSKPPKPFSNLNLQLGRWDNRILYKLFDQIIIGDKYFELSEKYLVSLATQSSLEKLSSLVEVTNHWIGPISASVFAAGDDELNLLLFYILYLRQCFSSIRERVTFHLVYPKDRPPTIVQINEDGLLQMDCSRPDNMLEELLKQRSSTTTKWRVKHPYPQNHLRNVARKNCVTKFVFLTDIDIIPSINLAQELDSFLRKVTCKSLCAFVVPTYEIDKRVKFPSNKTELVRLANKGLARPFHHKVFIYNQFATNFSRWQAAKMESPEAHISHPVTNFEFLYEPFYVAQDTVPPHDERFMGYGYTRNTQVYEMFVAGYEFMVLSPVFTCHWGLQVKRGRPAWREHQNNLNRKHFDTFKQEVFARYKKDPLKMLTNVREKPKLPFL